MAGCPVPSAMSNLIRFSHSATVVMWARRHLANGQTSADQGACAALPVAHAAAISAPSLAARSVCGPWRLQQAFALSVQPGVVLPLHLCNSGPSLTCFCARPGAAVSASGLSSVCRRRRQSEAGRLPRHPGSRPRFFAAPRSPGREDGHSRAGVTNTGHQLAHPSRRHSCTVSPSDSVVTIPHRCCCRPTVPRPG